MLEMILIPWLVAEVEAKVARAVPNKLVVVVVVVVPVAVPVIVVVPAIRITCEVDEGACTMFTMLFDSELITDDCIFCCFWSWGAEPIEKMIFFYK